MVIHDTDTGFQLAIWTATDRGVIIHKGLQRMRVAMRWLEGLQVPFGKRYDVASSSVPRRLRDPARCGDSQGLQDPFKTRCDVASPSTTVAWSNTIGVLKHDRGFLEHNRGVLKHDLGVFKHDCV